MTAEGRLCQVVSSLLPAEPATASVLPRTARSRCSPCVGHASSAERARDWSERRRFPLSPQRPRVDDNYGLILVSLCFRALAHDETVLARNRHAHGPNAPLAHPT